MSHIDHDDGWPQGSFEPSCATFDRIGSERRFGVELEYHDVPDFEELEDQTCFGAKEDCSVEGGEFDSPILYGDQGLAVVDHFCDLAEDHEFEPGVSGAGYHLHLDMTKESAEGLKRIALAYHYTKNLWLGAVPVNRRECTYSKAHGYTRQDVLQWKETGDVRNFSRDYERYTWVNWAAYWDHKTVEIRCHESTIRANDVNNWVIAHTRFCDATTTLGVGRITRLFGNKKPTELFRELRAIIQSPDVLDHLQNRYHNYNR